MDHQIQHGSVLRASLEEIEIPANTPELVSEEHDEGFDTDVAIDAANSLSRIQDTLAAHQGLNDVPSAEALKSVEIAVESLMKVCGLQAAMTPALEGYEPVRLRHKSVQVAIEEISENIKRILGKIVAWIRVATKKISLHLVDLFKGASAQNRKAKAINDAAVAGKVKYGAGASSKEFDDQDGFPKVLGECSAHELLSNYKKQMRDFSALFGRQVMISAVGTIRKLVQNIDSLEVKEATSDEIAKVVDECIGFLEKTALRAFSGDDEHKQYAALIGGGVFHLAIAKADGLRTSVSVDYESGKNDSAVLKALKVDEIIELTNAVMHATSSGTFPDYVEVAKGMTHLADDIERLCDRIVKRHSVKGGQIASLHMLKQITHALMMLSQQVYTYNVRVTAAINTYCQASLKSLAEEHGTSG